MADTRIAVRVGTSLASTSQSAVDTEQVGTGSDGIPTLVPKQEATAIRILDREGVAAAKKYLMLWMPNKQANAWLLKAMRFEAAK